MWALTYDYMITLLDEGHVARARPGHQVEHLRRRADLDLRHPQRREVVRRRGPHRRRHRLHLQPDPRRRHRGRHLGVLPRPASTNVTAPDATHGRAEAEEAQRRAAAAADPDRARARLEERQREGGQELRAEPKDGKPVVGSGPFRLVEGTAGGSTYRFEANPDYWGGAPHIDEVVFRVYKSEDPAVQALIKGEVDFVEDISALQVKALQDEPGITAHNGDSPGFDEIAFNTGSVDLETGEADRRPEPGRARPEVPARAGLRARPRPADLEGLPGRRRARAPRSSRRPTPTTTGTPPADEAFTFDPDKAGAAARRGRLQDGLRRAAHHARRVADRHAPAGRALRLADVARHHGLLQGVAGRPRHQGARSRPTSRASSPT